MGAVIVEIAEAVKAALAAASGTPALSRPITVERAYVPIHDLEDMDTRYVTVVPAGLNATPLNRSSDDFEYIIDVALQQRKPPTVGEYDPLMQLVQEIIDVFRGKNLAGYEQAKCTAVANSPIFVPMHIDEKQVFTSLVTLTFRVARAR